MSRPARPSKRLVFHCLMYRIKSMNLSETAKATSFSRFRTGYPSERYDIAELTELLSHCLTY
jgi:hypothetical protein